MEYGSGVETYKLFDLSNKKTIFIRDVIFNDSKSLPSDNISDAVTDKLVELENSADELLEGETIQDVLEETNNNSARRSTLQ